MIDSKPSAITPASTIASTTETMSILRIPKNIRPKNAHSKSPVTVNVRGSKGRGLVNNSNNIINIKNVHLPPGTKLDDIAHAAFKTLQTAKDTKPTVDDSAAATSEILESPEGSKKSVDDSNTAASETLETITEGIKQFDVDDGLEVVKKQEKMNVTSDIPDTKLDDIADATFETLQTAKDTKPTDDDSAIATSEILESSEGSKKSVDDSYTAASETSETVTEGIKQSDEDDGLEVVKKQEQMNVTPDINNSPRSTRLETVNHRTTPSQPEYSHYSRTTTIGGQSRNGKAQIKLSRLPLKDIKMPKGLQKDIEVYMLSNMDDTGPAANNTVRLWEPYRILKHTRQAQPRHCVIGDVGQFSSDGGFDVKFNIFLSKEENLLMNYNPPPEFEPVMAVEEDALFKRLPNNKQYYCSPNMQRKKKEISNDVFTFEWKGIPPERKLSLSGAALLVVPESCEKETIPPKHWKTILNYFNKNLPFWSSLDDIGDGSWNLIIVSYRSVIWGAAGRHESKYAHSSEPELRGQIKRLSDQRDYEWEAANTDDSFSYTQSCVATDGDTPCTIAVEILTIVRRGWIGNGKRVFSKMFNRSRSTIA